jgi:hypothetical protein
MYVRPRRILALDLRPRSFGFVVFEGPDQLLDWGVKAFHDLSGRTIPASTKIVPLIAEFEPAVVLLKSTVWQKKSTKAQLDSLLDAIRVGSSDRTSVRLISPQRIRRMFPGGVRNKDDLASRVAARFPDLAWKLPPPRTYPHREHYRMSIFDAAALALAYYGPREPSSPA